MPIAMTASVRGSSAHPSASNRVARRATPRYRVEMVGARAILPGELAKNADQRIILHDVDWWQYETLLAVRGDRAGVRMTYLRGELELMSPSSMHEVTKKLFARLLEAFAEERALDLNGYGSMTMRSAPKERGAEPDECYILGAPKEIADLAIEVIWTSGGIDKLDVYRSLGVREVWFWEKSKVRVHALRSDRYEEIPRSELLPDIDIDLLAGFIGRTDQTRAVREYRERIRAAQHLDPSPRARKRPVKKRR